MNGYAEWFKFSGKDVLALPNRVDTTRTTYACLNWLALAQSGWKNIATLPSLANLLHVSSYQSASCEFMITDFGCLP